MIYEIRCLMDHMESSVSTCSIKTGTSPRTNLSPRLLQVQGGLDNLCSLLKDLGRWQRHWSFEELSGIGFLWPALAPGGNQL